MLCGLGFSVFSSQINIFLEKYILINEYVGYVGSEIKLNYTGFIIQSAIFVFCLLYYKQVTKNRNNLILYNLSFMGMVLQLYSSVIAEFFRVSMYFSIFDIILVPLVLEHEKERRNRSLLLFLVTSVLILYIFIQGEIKYDVFWR